jgi:hypothetical protein
MCLVRQPPVRPRHPRYRGFTIILRHTTLGKTPLDEGSAQRRDVYLKSHNIHNRQISMAVAGFETAIPARGQPQTHALDRAATGTGVLNYYENNYSEDESIRGLGMEIGYLPDTVCCDFCEWCRRRG